MTQKKFLTKITASFLVLTFSYSQLLYAADVRQMILDAKAFFDQEAANRPGGSSSLSPQDLTAAQTQAAAVVTQQQTLQDLSNTNFSLTTQNGDVLKYVGSKLNEVTRPDGSELHNITTDLNGNITNADLKLSDGSVQIYQNGQVLGYQTPDGTQVIYSNGTIQKTIDKNGIETLYSYGKDAQGNNETVLDNPSYTTKYDQNGKIKESTRKSDNQKSVYSNGKIQKITKSDGSQELFTWTTQGTDTVVTSQGGSSSLNTYTDTQGNVFTFGTGGTITQVKLTDNSVLTNITWNMDNTVKDATLTDASNTKYTYQNKVLTMSTDSQGVVTNYTYSTNTITVSSQGNAWVYDLNKNPISYTDIYGTITTYLTQGSFKGLRDRDTTSTGQVFVYDYKKNADNSVSVEKRELHQQTYGYTTWQGTSPISQTNNPYLFLNARFENDNSFDPQINITATGTGKNLSIKLLPTTDSSYTFNGVTTAFNVTMTKGTIYTVEVRWETSRIGIYVYPQGTTKPSTPQGTISDRSWDVTFKAVSQNAYLSNPWDPSYNYTSRGVLNQTFSSNAQNFAYLPTSASERITFNQSSNYRDIYLKAKQTSGNIYRTITLWWVNSSNSWSATTSDWNSSTNVTTNTNSSVTQTLTSGVDYIADFKVEGSNLNFYVYQKNTDRPLTPTVSFSSLNVPTEFEANFTGAMAKTELYKNLTSPTYSSILPASLTPRVDTVKNLTLTKATAPQGISSVDFSSVTYDSNSQVKQIILKDNSKLTFTNGLLTQDLDPQGNSTTFNFAQSALSNVVGASIVQSNLTSTYTSEGKLSSVKTGEITIHYKKDSSNTVEWIEKTDGTELWNLVFDTNGNLTGALIIAPDGEERQYQTGKLVALKRPDQSELFYNPLNSQVLKMITPEKLTYNFNYTTPNIVKAVLDTTVVPVPDLLTPITMEYDTSFNLKKVTRQNQEVINYLNNQVSQIDAPSSSSKVFSYQKDSSGNILSYTVTQGNVITTYDSNNQPTSAVINPDSSNPNTLNISYQYGKIRQIKKNNVVTFNYSYTFDPQGNEITQIDDVETNTTKIYQAGNLMTSLDKANSVLSTYSYESFVIASEAKQSLRVKQVEVTRFGRTLHTYNYSYSGTNTIVTDETSIIRTYDANQKLILLEKEGQKFQYTYTPQTVQDSVTESALSATTKTAWNGQLMEYTMSLSKAGDIKVSVEALNNGALPKEYLNYQFEAFVDGTSKGIFNVAANTTVWQGAIFSLTNVAQGSHTVQLKWINPMTAGSTQANLTYRNLSFKQLTPVTHLETITTEDLIEKKLSDGSLAKYSSGKLVQVELTNGKVLKNIVTDSAGNILEGVSFASKTATIGTKYLFDQGQITKAVLSTGQELLYSYDKDSAGKVINTYITKGSVKLKYSSTGSWLGLKIVGVLDPNEVKASTKDVYTGSGNGPQSIDGDFNTWFYESYKHSSGGVGTVVSEHDFTQNEVVNSVTFSMYAFGRADGSYTKDYEAYYYVEALQNGVWQQVPGSFGGTYKVTGSGSYTASSGVVTLNNLNLQNVTAIRAFAHGYGNSSDNANADGAAGIYEIQYTLADLANLTYAPIKNSSGTTTGYQLSGYYGPINFDTTGNLTLSNTNYTSTQQEMTSVIQSYVSLPYKYTDFDRAREVTSDTQAVLTQEYASDGTLETQSKQDGTVTLFENNKPSKVLDSTGVILIQYTYDAQGNPTRIYLKNARDTLPDQVAKAKQSIEGQRDQQLRDLASQQNLAYQAIQTQFQNYRTALENQITVLQNQFNDVSSISVKGKKAKSQRGDALNLIGNAVGSARGQLASSYSQEADAYANLNGQVKAASDKIELDSQSAFTELSKQENNLKQEILRQEVSPIVYDYYRRILGRDPDSNEYNFWVSRIDYDSGSTLNEAKAFVDSKPLSFWAQNNVPLSIEAEDFHTNLAQGTDSWQLQTNDPKFSGGNFLVAGPDDNSSTTNILTQSPRLDYKVYFDTPGTYYLWVRGYGTDGNSDSVYTGLDGVLKSAYVGSFPISALSWVRRDTNGAIVSFTVSTPGEHILNFWMREDGFRFDKFVLTQDANFTPSVFGPIESLRKNAPLVNLTQVLQDYLNALPELAERQTYVNTVKQNVTTSINNYLAMSQTDKETFAATLGLTPQDLVPFSSSDSAKITNWLNSRSNHFGQSAFLALESLLDQKGISYVRTDLAQKAILIDVLTGVISPLDDGELVLSVFSLNKVAGLYGVTLTGANLTWTDLTKVLPLAATTTSSRLIAHINGNHFVILTAISSTSITYIDTGIGKDKQNQTITVTKDAFLKAWKGNVTFETTKYTTLTSGTSPSLTARMLSVNETKTIRGAFWGSLLNFFGFVLNIILPGLGIPFQIAALAFSIAEGDWISGISSVVSLGFGDFGKGILNVFKGAFQGFTNALGPLGQIIQGVGQVFGNIFTAVKGFVTNVIDKVGGFLKATGIGSETAAKIAEKAVRNGVEFGVTKGLETLGVNPVIAGLAGSFTAGSNVNSIQSGTLSIGNDFGAGIKAVLVLGNQFILQNSNISPALKDALSVVATSFANGIQSGNIGGSLVKIIQDLPKNLSFYAVDKLAKSLGLDPKIAGVISAPISSILSQALISTKWIGQIPTSASDGVTINQDTYYDAERRTSIPIPGPGTPQGSWWDSVFGFLKSNIPLMIGAGIAAYYLTQPKTVSSGQTLPSPTTTEMPLPPGAVAVTYQDYFTGQNKAGYQINSSPTSYIVYDKLNGLPVKRVSNGVMEEGKFEVQIVLNSDGSVAVSFGKPSYLSQGKITYTTPQSGKARFTVVDKKVSEIYIDATSPDLTLDPGTTKDSTNKIINGVVKVISLGLELSVVNGVVSKSTGGQQGSQELTNKLRPAYIFGNGFNNAVVPEGTTDTLIPPFFGQLLAKGLVDAAKTLFVALYETTNIVGNLIDWFSDFVTYNNTLVGGLDLVQEFVARLGNDPFFFVDVMAGAIKIQDIPAPLQSAIQSIQNERNAWFGGLKNNLVDEVFNDLVNFENSKGIVDGIVFTHSGAFQPFMKAIQRTKADGNKFDIHTVINYEGPYWFSRNDTIDNPNLKRIINVWGTRFDAAPPIWSFDKADFKGANLTPNINIKILGAKHNDFSYSATDLRWTPNPNANKRLEREINFKTSAFMQELYRAAKDQEVNSSSLDIFFEALKIQGSATLVNGIWQIEPRKLPYPIDYVY